MIGRFVSKCKRSLDFVHRYLEVVWMDISRFTEIHYFCKPESGLLKEVGYRVDNMIMIKTITIRRERRNLINRESKNKVVFKVAS